MNVHASRALTASAGISALVVLALGAAPADSVDPEPLRRVREEIRRLEGELSELERREQGLLVELERLSTELRLAGARVEETSMRIDALGEGIDRGVEELERLELAQDARRRYLRFRLREMYKEGSEQVLRRWVAGEGDGGERGRRYAAYLSERDARVLRALREDARRLDVQRQDLVSARRELDATLAEQTRARDRVDASRARRARLLREVRDDQRQRRRALDELRSAAEELSRVVDTLDEAQAGLPGVDLRQLRGLLDWPAEGRVSAGFGTLVHPRFKTRVPHPGLDIEAEEGTRITAVFDGRVVFADWMRGYGLTVIVDHGGGVLSIYAHASVLLVESGEAVVRGQRLGLVGETGSLRGPFLYFELRVNGEPVDPIGWLRSR